MTSMPQEPSKHKTCPSKIRFLERQRWVHKAWNRVVTAEIRRLIVAKMRQMMKKATSKWSSRDPTNGKGRVNHKKTDVWTLT